MGLLFLVMYSWFVHGDIIIFCTQMTFVAVVICIHYCPEGEFVTGPGVPRMQKLRSPLRKPGVVKGSPFKAWSSQNTFRLLSEILNLCLYSAFYFTLSDSSSDVVRCVRTVCETFA